ARSGMRTLCFGGTFNPIRHGHLICARAAAEGAGFDRVLLIPSANPPLRGQEQDLISATDRLTMCQLAVDKLPFFAVSDLELSRSEPSYTIDTARMLRLQGHHNVNFLIGVDNVAQLHLWQVPAALM